MLAGSIERGFDIMTDHEMVRLGEVCEAITGAVLDRALITDNEEGIPVVLLSDVEDGVTDSYYSGSYDANKLVDSGDYVVSMSDHLMIEEWLGSRALLSQHLCRLAPDLDKLDPSYMCFALRYIFGKLEDDDDADIEINHITVEALLDTVIPLPSLEEQALIVDVLNNAYDLMELQIEQMNRANALMKARFLEMFGDVEENSMGWDVHRLGDLAERLKSRSILAKERQPGSYPYYDSTGVVDNVDNFLFDEELLLVAKVGSVLTSEERVVARAVKGKLWASDLVHVLRLSGGVVPEFVEMVINSLDISSRLRGGVMPKLPTAALNELPIICPPIELQVEFVAFLKTIDEQDSLMASRLEDIAQICHSLNQRYFESSMSYE